MRSADMWQSVGLLNYFAKAHPVRSALMVLMITMAALSEGFGMLSLLPLIGLVINAEGTDSTLMPYVEWVFDVLGLEISLGGLLVVIVLAMGLKSLLMLLAMVHAGYTAAHVAACLRINLVRALSAARWTYFTGQHAGHLASAVGAEPTRASASYTAFCQVVSAAVQLLIYLALSISISWEVSLVALVVGVFVTAVLSRFVAMSRHAGNNQTERQKSFMSFLLQGLDGMKPLKAMACTGSLGLVIEEDIHALNRAQRAVVFSRAALMESHEVIRTLAVAGALYAFLTILGQSIDGVLVLALLFMRSLQKVNLIQDNYQSTAANLPAFIFLRSAVVEIERAREPSLGSVVPRLDSAISVRDVSFSYSHGKVLDGVSMTLPAGAFVAVVGPSGAGKTTVADLIIGLLRPQQGEVWIDDVPMRDIDTEVWRGMIGYVPQETFLFHDTVVTNVTLGEPGITRKQVEAALRRAEAWAFIAELPDGMDTTVGERGTRLSGGQRQRIAIARALIRDPALLILDEATTALDPETEDGIVTTIRRLAGKITVLSISHQLAMRRAADRVYRLDSGRVTMNEKGKGVGMPVVGSYG